MRRADEVKAKIGAKIAKIDRTGTGAPAAEIREQ
jgi:hypothetical protein